MLSLVHTSVVIAMVIVLERSVKTQCESKIVFVSIVIGSAVSVTMVVIVRIKSFPFSYDYDADCLHGMNRFNVIASGVAGVGKKELTDHKTLISSLASLKNGKIFKRGKNGHF